MVLEKNMSFADLLFFRAARGGGNVLYMKIIKLLVATAEERAGEGKGVERCVFVHVFLFLILLLPPPFGLFHFG